MLPRDVYLMSSRQSGATRELYNYIRDFFGQALNNTSPIRSI